MNRNRAFACRLEHCAEVATPIIVVHECALAVAGALDHEVKVAGEVESGEAGHGLEDKELATT
jgi:hypothetical protein